jgi:cytochrome bd-type quinol oxidase subunit 2
VVITPPAILIYTPFVYRAFRGKATAWPQTLRGHCNMTEATRQGLDTFTKRYLTALLVLAAALLLWWLAGFDSRLSELNDMLRSDPELAGYPYQFEVLSLESGVAEISSPRSAEVPVVQFLRLAYPELANTSVTDDSMMAAQAALVQVQSRAGKLVSSQDDVESIRWTLDRDWYAYHGIYLD